MTGRRPCDGGPGGRPCPTAPTWRVRDNELGHGEQRSPYADRAWSYACGRHLHFVSDEITCGEQMELVLERIRTDE